MGIRTSHSPPPGGKLLSLYFTRPVTTGRGGLLLLPQTSNPLRTSSSTEDTGRRDRGGPSLPLRPSPTVLVWEPKNETRVSSRLVSLDDESPKLGLEPTDDEQGDTVPIPPPPSRELLVTPPFLVSETPDVLRWGGVGWDRKSSPTGTRSEVTRCEVKWGPTHVRRWRSQHHSPLSCSSPTSGSDCDPYHDRLWKDR